MSLKDRLRDFGLNALKFGQRATERLKQQPEIQRGVDGVTDRWRSSRENVEGWLLGIEEDLWVWIRKMQDQAHQRQAQFERYQNSADYYEVLGLKPGAKMPEIKAAWREKMRANHPDRFANNPVAEAKAHKRAQKINQAYAELTALLTGRVNRRSE